MQIQKEGNMTQDRTCFKTGVHWGECTYRCEPCLNNDNKFLRLTSYNICHTGIQKLGIFSDTF